MGWFVKGLDRKTFQMYIDCTEREKKTMANISIKYNGSFPNLCSGHLVVDINGREWDFGCYALSSGGSVSFDNEWNEKVTRGKWSVIEWPEGFPVELKDEVRQAINGAIPHGCCGGCV